MSSAAWNRPNSAKAPKPRAPKEEFPVLAGAARPSPASTSAATPANYDASATHSTHTPTNPPQARRPRRNPNPAGGAAPVAGEDVESAPRAPRAPRPRRPRPAHTEGSAEAATDALATPAGSEGAPLLGPDGTPFRGRGGRGGGRGRGRGGRGAFRGGRGGARGGFAGAALAHDGSDVASPVAAGSGEGSPIAPVYRSGPLIDIGANLTSRRFIRDFAKVIGRAERVGLTAIIVTGTSLEESKNAIELAKSLQPTTKIRIFCTVGIHPHQAKDFDDTTSDQLETLITENKSLVVAIGECGLDFNRNYSPRDQQLACFEAQLQLAAKLGIPLFLHERDSEAEFLALITKYHPQIAAGGFCVHCFTGPAPLLERLVALGAYIGLTGAATEPGPRGQHIRTNILPRVPQDKLVIETDAPFQTPRNHPFMQTDHSLRNEPSYLPYILSTIAASLNVTERALAETTTRNAVICFRLPLGAA